MFWKETSALLLRFVGERRDKYACTMLIPLASKLKIPVACELRCSCLPKSEDTEKTPEAAGETPMPPAAPPGQGRAGPGQQLSQEPPAGVKSQIRLSRGEAALPRKTDYPPAPFFKVVAHEILPKGTVVKSDTWGKQRLVMSFCIKIYSMTEGKGNKKVTADVYILLQGRVCTVCTWRSMC